MARVLVRDLDNVIVERLKIRASQHNRSLEGEVKAILEAATRLSMSDARSLAEGWQRRLAGRINGDSSELIREDRER